MYTMKMNSPKSHFPRVRISNNFNTIPDFFLFVYKSIFFF